MTSRTELIVNTVIEHHPSLVAAAAREALRREIERDRHNLEPLRQREVELRAALVNELKHLVFNASIAEFKIETRAWADGDPALDIDFENVKEAADRLIDAVDDIKFAESLIEDKQAGLDDPDWEGLLG